MEQLVVSMAKKISEEKDVERLSCLLNDMQRVSNRELVGFVQSIYFEDSACHFPGDEFASLLTNEQIMHIASENGLHVIADVDDIAYKAIEISKMAIVNTVALHIANDFLTDIASKNDFEGRANNEEYFEDLLNSIDDICAASAPQIENGIRTMFGTKDKAHAFNALTIMINHLESRLTTMMGEIKSNMSENSDPESDDLEKYDFGY